MASSGCVVFLSGGTGQGWRMGRLMAVFYGCLLWSPEILLPSRVERRAEMHLHQLTAVGVNATRVFQTRAPTSTLSSWKLSMWWSCIWHPVQPLTCCPSPHPPGAAHSCSRGFPVALGPTPCLKVMGSLSPLPDGPWLRLRGRTLRGLWKWGEGGKGMELPS